MTDNFVCFAFVHVADAPEGFTTYVYAVPPDVAARLQAGREPAIKEGTVAGKHPALVGIDPDHEQDQLWIKEQLDPYLCGTLVFPDQRSGEMFHTTFTKGSLVQRGQV